MTNRDDAVEVDPPSEKGVQPDRVRVNFWLKRELYDLVLQVAAEDDTKIAPAIRQALKYYVKARKEGRT